MDVIFLPPTPPFYFLLLFKKWRTMSTFEYILIPDVKEGPNILTAIPRWKAECRGGGSIYQSSNIPIPFCLLNFKKRELFLGYSFWNPFVRLNVFTPKHNFVRIQKYILGRYILTSLSIFQFSWFYILHNLYQNFPEKIQIYCDLLLLLLLWLSVFHRCAIFTPPPPPLSH